jgi:hypothetical protein
MAPCVDQYANVAYGTGCLTENSKKQTKFIQGKTIGPINIIQTSININRNHKMLQSDNEIKAAHTIYR